MANTEFRSYRSYLPQGFCQAGPKSVTPGVNARFQDRVAKVSASDMVKSIRRANGKMVEIKRNLPAVLASQDAELTQLAEQMAAGTVTQEVYDARLAEIRETRATLALALSQSAEKAGETAHNLDAASRSAQPDLGWHIGAAQQLQREALSARAQITLL